MHIYTYIHTYIYIYYIHNGFAWFTLHQWCLYASASPFVPYFCPRPWMMFTYWRNHECNNIYINSAFNIYIYMCKYYMNIYRLYICFKQSLFLYACKQAFINSFLLWHASSISSHFIYLCFTFASTHFTSYHSSLYGNEIINVKNINSINVYWLKFTSNTDNCLRKIERKKKNKRINYQQYNIFFFFE